MNTFKYKKSFRIIHWGCCFDSLLELKFAISIHEDYEFIHARISVYYDPTNRRPTNYIRTGTKRYTPDFLIRHKQTGEAFWIEIKPRAFNDTKQITLKTLVAENYILWKNYDWKFKFIYDDQIHLNKEQQQIFDRCCQLKSKSAFKLKLQKLNDQYDRTMPPMFSPGSSHSDVQFVMFGTRKKPSLLL